MTTAKKRQTWIRQMWGADMQLDFNKRAKKVIDVFEPLEDWPSSYKAPRMDLKGVDIPRDDVTRLKIHRRDVFFGANKSNKKVGGQKKFIKKILHSNFTRDELKSVKKLYFECNPKIHAGWNACHQRIDYPGGDSASIISFPPRAYNDESAITHEMVHAVRAATGRDVRDSDKEEKETDLETTARLSYRELPGTGYYHHIPGVEDYQGARVEDRVLLTGSRDRKLRGKYAIQAAEKKYGKSQIKKAKISQQPSGRGEQGVSENRDRYFYIKTKDGRKIKVHQFYKGGKNSRLVDIKKGFRKRYGGGIRVWEWRDGRKVLIIGGKKK